MREITKGQIEQAKEIDRLMKEVFGEGYWEPEIGDRFIPKNSENCVATVIGLDKMGGRQLVSGFGLWLWADEQTPIPTWSDCRALLEEMGWHLNAHFDFADGKVRIDFDRWDDDRPQWITKQAPTDLEAIMLALKEVLERKVKEQADE